jgi:translation initiation factor 4A/THO complex subunit 6
MSRFDINGAVLSQIPSAPQSAFSVSVHPSGVFSYYFPFGFSIYSLFCTPNACHYASHALAPIAVGGYEGLVDIISQFGSHYCTFHCQCV